MPIAYHSRAISTGPLHFSSIFLWRLKRMYLHEVLFEITKNWNLFISYLLFAWRFKNHHNQMPMIATDMSSDTSGTFQEQYGHFDLTVTSQWQLEIEFDGLFQLSTFLTLEIRLSKYEVILAGGSWVWTRAAHFRTNLVIFESTRTSQWQSETEFDDFFFSYRFF